MKYEWENYVGCQFLIVCLPLASYLPFFIKFFFTSILRLFRFCSLEWVNQVFHLFIFSLGIRANFFSIRCKNGRSNGNWCYQISEFWLTVMVLKNCMVSGWVPGNRFAEYEKYWEMPTFWIELISLSRMCATFELRIRFVLFVKMCGDVGALSENSQKCMLYCNKCRIISRWVLSPKFLVFILLTEKLIIRSVKYDFFWTQSKRSCILLTLQNPCE